MAEPIDIREIRGLNGKLILNGISIIISFTFSLALVYTGIVNKIDNNKIDIDHKLEIQKIEFNELKVRVATLELLVNRIKKSEGYPVVPDSVIHY